MSCQAVKGAETRKATAQRLGSRAKLLAGRLPCVMRPVSCLERQEARSWSEGMFSLLQSGSAVRGGCTTCRLTEGK